MPDTRSGKTAGKPLTEAEIETLQDRLNKKDEKLKEEAALLEKQREEYERSVREFNKYREQMEKDMKTCKTDIVGDDAPRIASDNVMREIEQMRRELELLRREIHPTPRHSEQGFPIRESSEYQYDHPLNPAQIPKVSFREATDSVPVFDGYNIPLSQFNKACRRAKEIIPPSAERNLTKLLINKLRGRVYSAVEDEPCDNLTQLIDLLIVAFGSKKTIDQHRGELSMIYLKPQEHILDYISRMKELRAAILDAERRETGTVALATEAEINLLTGRSFCQGLPLEYCLQMEGSLYYKPFEAFSAAKIIAKEQELDKNRFGTRDRLNYENGNTNYGRRQYVLPTPSREQYSDPRSNHATLMMNSRADHPRIDHPSHGYSRFDHRQSGYSHAENPRNAPQYSERPRDEYSRANSFPNNNNRPTSAPRDPPSRTTGRPDVGQDVKQCRYCKNLGHEINECRKRAYI